MYLQFDFRHCWRQLLSFDGFFSFLLFLFISHHPSWFHSNLQTFLKSTILALFSRFQCDFAFLPVCALVLITSTDASTKKCSARVTSWNKKCQKISILLVQFPLRNAWASANAFPIWPHSNEFIMLLLHCIPYQQICISIASR